MRINIVINDQTIMEDIMTVIADMERDEEISFQTDNERKEFADDCLDEIASKIECWEDYFPTFERVWDAVKRTAEDR